MTGFRPGPLTMGSSIPRQRSARIDRNSRFSWVWALVVVRPVLLVRDPLRHLERAGDGLRPVGPALAGLDELHGEDVLALDAPVAMVRAVAMGPLGIDGVGRAVARLRGDDPLTVGGLLDPVEGRQSQAALLAIVHLPDLPRLLFVSTSSIRPFPLLRQEAGYILLVETNGRRAWRSRKTSRWGWCHCWGADAGARTSGYHATGSVPRVPEVQEPELGPAQAVDRQAARQGRLGPAWRSVDRPTPGR